MIHFIPNTKKYDKFENILKGCKEYHQQDSRNTLLKTIRNNKFSTTKNLIKISKLEKTTLSRNLRKLKEEKIVDYNRGIGNSKRWYALI